MDGYAKQQIAELLAKAAFALDQRDNATLQTCFHPRADFVLRIGDADASEHEGREAIMNLIESAQTDDSLSSRHVISNIWYSQTGEHNATVVSYLSLAQTRDGSTMLKTTGVYTDDVAKASIDGGWVIMRRSLHLDSAYA